MGYWGEVPSLKAAVRRLSALGAVVPFGGAMISLSTFPGISGCP